MRRAALALVVALVAAGAAAVGCKAERTGRSATPVRFEVAGQGEVAPLVIAAMAKAAGEQRRLLVYAGASWCAPCNALHEAVARGELDDALPGLTLLEFDADEDADRLAVAGYRPKLIPMIVRPAADGTATELRVEGAQAKGDPTKQIAGQVAAILAAP